MTESNGVSGIQRRTLWVVLAAVAAVLIAIGAWGITSARDAERTAQDTSSSEGAADPSPQASPTASEAAADAAEDGAGSDEGEAEVPVTVVNGVALPEKNVAPPVSFEEQVQIAPSFRATVDEIRAIDGVGQGIGEISGPALAFTITLTNDTKNVLKTAGAVVNLYDSTASPAIPLLGDPNADPLTGSIAPGASVTGTYVFRVPPEARDSVTLTIAFDPELSVVVFTGPID